MLVLRRCCLTIAMMACGVLGAASSAAANPVAAGAWAENWGYAIWLPPDTDGQTEVDIFAHEIIGSDQPGKLDWVRIVQSQCGPDGLDKRVFESSDAAELRTSSFQTTSATIEGSIALQGIDERYGDCGGRGDVVKTPLGSFSLGVSVAWSGTQWLGSTGNVQIGSPISPPCGGYSLGGGSVVPHQAEVRLAGAERLPISGSASLTHLTDASGAGLGRQAVAYGALDVCS